MNKLCIIALLGLAACGSKEEAKQPDAYVCNTALGVVEINPKDPDTKIDHGKATLPITTQNGSRGTAEIDLMTCVAIFGS